MRRRTFLAAAAGAGILWWVGRPGDEGAAYDEYFRALNAELKAHGPMRPCLIVDLDRLDRNIAVLRGSIRAPKHYRVVAKSLPSVPLIDYVFKKAETDRLMAFHAPFLLREAVAFPAADILLGKPMPVAAAASFYSAVRGGFDPARQLQWLIDTPERLAQYGELAHGLGTRLRLNIEIDVGLHRGGVADLATLDGMLRTIAADPRRLAFAGFMGYDPHVVKVPRVVASRAALVQAVRDTYQGCVDLVRRQHAPLWRDDLTLNGAGSPTYRLYEDDRLVNDLAVGSALVKPTDFDVDTLAEHVPAAFIATPVLKVADGLRLPGSDTMSRVVEWWDPNRRRTYFIYGGRWMADYDSPAGLRANPLYGYSSNQEMVNGSAATGLAVDDHVFLRPTQSEAVLLQFGDLLTVRGGRLKDRWPVLQT
jgi:D-serine deaminase-like pyridoxal phosphate-dependent protein